MDNQEITISYGGQHKRNRKRVEKIINRQLKATEEIHTHTDGTLIICEDRAYHMLLHVRTKALKACGHANWRRCWICKEYDKPENLYIPPYISRAHHRRCMTRYRFRKGYSKFIFEDGYEG